MQFYSLFISGKLLYLFQVVSPPIIRSTHNCIYSIWYLSNHYCYLPKPWNWFECGVGIVLCSWWWVEIPPETCRAVFQK